MLQRPIEEIALNSCPLDLTSINVHTESAAWNLNGQKLIIQHEQDDPLRPRLNGGAIIEHQRAQAEQAGFKIDKVITDNGVSGISTKLSERPEGKQAVRHPAARGYPDRTLDRPTWPRLTATFPDAFGTSCGMA